MARKKQLMTYVEEKKSGKKYWRAQYKKTPLRVYVKSLGLEPAFENEPGSEAAANEWYLKRCREIDDAIPPELAEAAENLRKLTLEVGEPAAVPPELEKVRHLWDVSKPSEKSLPVNLDKFFELQKVTSTPRSIQAMKYYVAYWKEALATKSLEDIDAKLIEVLYLKVYKDFNTEGTRKKYYDYFKAFVNNCYELEKIDNLPRNINNERYNFTVPKTQKNLPPLHLVRDFIKSLPPRLELYCRLALEASMNNCDIGALTDSQINWKAKPVTLTRKRVKTKDEDNVPTVKYALSPRVVELLKQEGNPFGDFLLTDAKGATLYSGTYDKIKTAFREYFKKNKSAKKTFTMKDFRDIGSMIIQASGKKYAWAQQAWLGHSPKDPSQVNYSGEADVREVCRYIVKTVFGKSRQIFNPPYHRSHTDHPFFS